MTGTYECGIMKGGGFGILVSPTLSNIREMILANKDFMAKVRRGVGIVEAGGQRRSEEEVRRALGMEATGER